MCRFVGHRCVLRVEFLQREGLRIKRLREPVRCKPPVLMRGTRCSVPNRRSSTDPLKMFGPLSEMCGVGPSGYAECQA